MSTNTFIPVLEQKIPEFVRDKYPNFVQFIKDYLTFLEQDENFLGIAQDWRINNEPSNEVEPYLDAMLKDLGFVSDQHLVVKKSMIAHLLRDFYLSRGSQASFKFLFRALFDSDVDIRYPREEMLVPSDAEYGTRYFIYTSSDTRFSRVFQTILEGISENGGTATGLTSGTVATIENISIIFGDGIAYYQIEILDPPNQFINSELIRIESNNLEVVETMKVVLDINIANAGYGYSASDLIMVGGTKVKGSAFISSLSKGGVTGLTITAGGSGYSVGDTIYASTLDDGFGFSAKVSTVGGGGAITGVVINSRGYNYSALPNIQIRGPGTGAILTPQSNQIGSINRIRILEPYVDFNTATLSVQSTTGTGAVLTQVTNNKWSISNWENRKGFIGENSTLIDSDKYQQFSYTIVSGIPAKEYNSFVDELLHPVGYVKNIAYEIVSGGSLNIASGYQQDGSSQQYIYEHSGLFDFTLGYATATIDVDFIVTSSGEQIVTNTGDPIIATF